MDPQAGGRANPGKWIDALSSVGVWIAGALMLLVALSMFYEAVARRFFGSPTTWVMAFSILAALGVWSVKLAGVPLPKSGTP